MARLIAYKDSGRYVASIIKFDKPEVKEVLDKEYPNNSSGRYLIAAGDIMALRSNMIMRSIGQSGPRHHQSLEEIFSLAKIARIHHISLCDRNDEIMQDLSDLIAENEDGFFIENLNQKSVWHHVIDDYAIHEISQKAA